MTSCMKSVLWDGGGGAGRIPGTVGGSVSADSSTAESDPIYASIDGAAEGNVDDTTELFVHNEDGSSKSLSVMEGLRTCDLCELLAVKNHVTRDPSWCLVERWNDPAIERIVEDGEDVLTAYRDMLTAHYDAAFFFKRDTAKYEFFNNPQTFFPEQMTQLPKDKNGGGKLVGDLERTMTLQNMLTSSSSLPEVFGWLWLSGPEARVWRRAFFWLRQGDLYYSMEPAEDIPDRDPSRFALFVRLEEYTVYTCGDARRDFKAPCDQAIVLRNSCPDATESESRLLRCLACDSADSRRCWITALRLAKFGRQLYDSYNYQRVQLESETSRGRVSSFSGSSPRIGGSSGCAFRPRTSSNIGVAGESSRRRGARRNAAAAEYTAAQLPERSVRSLMALNAVVSSPSCRSDQDDTTVSGLAAAFKRINNTSGSPRVPGSMVSGTVSNAVHATQPWYHGALSGDEAAQLLSKYNDINGVFLVRGSRSNPAAYVLSFMFANKVYHAQILPKRDVAACSGCPHLSLDGGRTNFYDLLQLVEFYQLNPGVLPTRLTHFITHGHTDTRAAPQSC